MLCRVLSRLPLILDKSETKARPNGRALSLWGLVLVGSTTLALTESNPLATALALLLIPAFPSSQDWWKRGVLILLALTNLILGTQLLTITVPIALVLCNLGRPAIPCLGLLLGAVLLHPQLQSLPNNYQSTIPLASFGFIAFTPWLTALIYFKLITIQARLALFLIPVALALTVDLASGYWISTALFTDPIFRFILAIAPVVITAWFSRLKFKETLSLQSIFIPAVLSGLVVLAIPVAPISAVTFDESHGEWETVKSAFGPSDFGRGANYTYSLLFEKTKRLVGKSNILENEGDKLPEIDTLLVIKMPTVPLTEEFSKKLEDWVERGGRLLLVADHTDLYDTTQNSNALLKKHFGISINSDATYDSIGMPAIPTTAFAGGMLGRIDAHNQPVAWQTGASFQSIPLRSVELMTYGLSFAEPGDYSRPNRFGPFVPDLSKRYFNHSALIATPHGSGSVAVLLDSTPWSNFSIFRVEYTRMLRGLVNALEHTIHINLLSVLALTLPAIALASIFFQLRFLNLLLSALIGATLAAGFSIGSISWTKNVDSRDFGLRVVAGHTARLEFLKQILVPGERNYSRIVSATGKYGMMPLASAPGLEIPKLSDAKRWLFIEPSSKQLPTYKDALLHLESGNDLTIMFSLDQATDKEILTWLRKWGLVTLRSNGLSIFDGIKNSSGSFLTGRTPILAREIRVVTAARGTSILNSYATDQFFQTYTVRPTTLPRTSGFLTIGFAAEQFSDDAVGEVWEGIYPSSLGQQREKLLASVLLGEERPALMPDSLVRAQRSQIDLRAFLVLENGEQKFKGDFKNEKDDDATSAYLRALRDQAVHFITNNCEADSRSEITQCSSRLLGDDLIEWLVSWRSSDDGDIMTIELLHERRMSGLGATWNVLFGN